MIIRNKVSLRRGVMVIGQIGKDDLARGTSKIESRWHIIFSIHVINISLKIIYLHFYDNLQGEEIGMSNTEISWADTTDPQACNTNDPINYWKSSRDPARTPFQWDDTSFAGISI